MKLIGIGNEFRQDDAVGLYVVRQLRAKKLKDWKLVESSGEVTQLMDLWKKEKKVIVVDALVSGAAVGTILRFEAHRESLPAQSFRGSSHSLGLHEAIELSRAMQQLPDELIVYGIEAKTFENGKGLSPEVRLAAEKLIGELT
ncbi:MAG: hydrogenase maturation protease [Deltaproteobacteria bacterium]|nr:hydrogenase maturation protease [Deltaproteobacteria bacterium]